jgi:predicted transcriptional regulator
LSSMGKRDRMQIIAEILAACKKPQTQTYIRRKTNISYDVLQRCIMYLLIRQWLLEVTSDTGQKKLAITKKGLVFLSAWIELQRLADPGSKRKRHLSLAEFQAVKVSEP